MYMCRSLCKCVGVYCSVLLTVWNATGYIISYADSSVLLSRGLARFGVVGRLGASLQYILDIGLLVFPSCSLIFQNLDKVRTYSEYSLTHCNWFPKNMAD